jgi:hypothetical protein
MLAVGSRLSPHSHPQPSDLRPPPPRLMPYFTPAQKRAFFKAQERRKLKSLAAAIKLVKVNAIRRSGKRKGQSNGVIVDTFMFVDQESTGRLTRQQVQVSAQGVGLDATCCL